MQRIAGIGVLRRVFKDGIKQWSFNQKPYETHEYLYGSFVVFLLPPNRDSILKIAHWGLIDCLDTNQN